MIGVLDWIVIIFSFFGLLKIAFILVNKRAWLPVINEVYGKPYFWSPVFLILAGISFYYLIQELSIVQIFAVMAFTSFFVAIGLLQYSNEFLMWAKEAMDKKIDAWLIIYMALWVLLTIWALYEIYLKI